jgi:hypothetical protein
MSTEIVLKKNTWSRGSSTDWPYMSRETKRREEKWQRKRKVLEDELLEVNTNRN